MLRREGLRPCSIPSKSYALASLRIDCHDDKCMYHALDGTTVPVRCYSQNSIRPYRERGPNIASRFHENALAALPVGGRRASSVATTMWCREITTWSVPPSVADDSDEATP